MLATMTKDPWIEFKNRIETLAELPEWSQSRIARAAGVSVKTLNTFLRSPGRGLQADTFSKLRRVVDTQVPNGTSSAESSGAGFNRAGTVQSYGSEMIPVVDLDAFDFSSEDDMAQRLSEEALYFVPVPGSRKSWFVARVPVVIRLRKGTLMPGDLLVIDRKREPKKGLVILIAIGKTGLLADLEEDETGVLVACTADGRRHREYQRVGIVRFKMEDWGS